MTDQPYGSFTPREYQAFIRTAAAELQAAVRVGPEDTPVPACPGWTLRDLVAHLGAVHEWAASIVASGAAERPERVAPATPPTGAELTEWYDQQVRLLLETLARTDPAQACWTHQRGYRVAAYWSRRQAHELAMHLVDAESALGRTPHYDAGLAVDGIGEVLDVWLPRVAAYTKRHPDLAGPLALRCTDRPELWLLAPCPDTAPKITGPHLGGAPQPGAGGPVVAEIRGGAVDLLLALWKRLDLDQLTVEGDADVARRFLASALTP
ncbi:maleylpyruvate isomerase family mycothiol-dependent enzyme [Actinopolymorpha sp. B9G3]|uniref:maleylpyruvate isomerase family mycothiol-dependent enzyme n=1 Tax=Actinopolymorpha sp. B9G3 TaxID=3158970 RepID=UPI0032D91502